LAGEAFLILLSAPDFTFKPEYMELLLKEANKMLQLWSADILEIWVEVYALVLKVMIAEADDTKRATL
jgi:hypothetical protein